jgi:hypothetical protein
MATTTSEQFQFDLMKRLIYKKTTTTTNGSGAVTGVSVFRAVFPPDTDVASVPASLSSQCTLEWTASVRSAYNDMLSASSPPVGVDR